MCFPGLNFGDYSIFSLPDWLTLQNSPVELICTLHRSCQHFRMLSSILASLSFLPLIYMSDQPLGQGISCNVSKFQIALAEHVLYFLSKFKTHFCLYVYDTVYQHFSHLGVVRSNASLSSFHLSPTHHCPPPPLLPHLSTTNPSFGMQHTMSVISCAEAKPNYFSHCLIL